MKSASLLFLVLCPAVRNVQAVRLYCKAPHGLAPPAFFTYLDNADSADRTLFSKKTHETTKEESSMPTTQFICPDGKAISMQSCLDHCRMARRCMFLPTLRAAAKSLRRSLVSASVTELLASTRETFLKKTVDYAVRPQSVLYALHGQAVHFLHEGHTDVYKRQE